MLVYMLVNVITEKAYVGQTQKSLAERWRDHKKQAMGGSTAPLHVAMREWNNDDLWDRVVLQCCYSVAQLDEAEEAWTEACSTRDGAVGYNAKKQSPVPEHPGSIETGKLAFHNPNAARPKALMSEEERQKFREWGKKGAAASKKKCKLSDGRDSSRADA